MCALNQICFTDEANCVKFSGHRLKPNMCISCMKEIAKHNEKTVSEEDLVKVCNKSSRSQMFCKIGALKNFAKFTGKHLCQCLFLKRASDPGVFL